MLANVRMARDVRKRAQMRPPHGLWSEPRRTLILSSFSKKIQVRKTAKMPRSRRFLSGPPEAILIVSTGMARVKECLALE